MLDLGRVLLFGAIFAVGCTREPSEPQPIVSVTRPVGSWQGRGTATVGDIPSETGRFRITWRTSNESPAGAGTFKLTLRSAISGRTLGIVADHKGVGSGTAPARWAAIHTAAISAFSGLKNDEL